MDPMKIALMQFDKRIGGGHIALANLAFALSRRGHEVHILLGAKDIPDRMAKMCLPYCHLHFLPGYHNLLDVPKLVERVKHDVLSLYKIHKFDVLNAEGLSGWFVPPELQKKLIVSLHGNNIARGLMLLKYLGNSFDACKAAFYSPMESIKNIVGHFVYGKFESEVCKRAKLVVTLTKTGANCAKEYYNVPEEKIRIVPNVVTLPADNSYYELPIDEGNRIILSVSPLVLVKGIPLLIKAIEKILSYKKDVVYVFIGSGPLFYLLQRLASRFPRRVIVLPSVSSGLASIYKGSTMLIHGSVYEAFSLAIGEAMFVGKPVIGLNVASIPELVINKATGFLVRPFSSKDLAEKSIALLEDEKKTRRMGLNAKKMITELCSPLTVGSRMENVYEEVLTK